MSVIRVRNEVSHDRESRSEHKSYGRKHDDNNKSWSKKSSRSS